MLPNKQQPITNLLTFQAHKTPLLRLAVLSSQFSYGASAEHRACEQLASGAFMEDDQNDWPRLSKDAPPFGCQVWEAGGRWWSRHCPNRHPWRWYTHNNELIHFPEFPATSIMNSFGTFVRLSLVPQQQCCDVESPSSERVTHTWPIDDRVNPATSWECLDVFRLVCGTWLFDR